ncbi:MAG TPA: hypothetical protein VE863_11935 [Pyrinomonadaceae bacterium]|jgi:hypothetical protein|nr:hypothetical protein [Pyrinomonadaceae bacterium]
MRNYPILKEKARQSKEDAEIQALLAEIRSADDARPLGGYERACADEIKSMAIDRYGVPRNNYRISG